jgi:hypothetical protein
MSADDVLPPRTAHNIEFRHGYTLDQRLTCASAAKPFCSPAVYG